MRLKLQSYSMRRNLRDFMVNGKLILTFLSLSSFLHVSSAWPALILKNFLSNSKVKNYSNNITEYTSNKVLYSGCKNFNIYISHFFIINIPKYVSLLNYERIKTLPLQWFSIKFSIQPFSSSHRHNFSLFVSFENEPSIVVFVLLFSRHSILSSQSSFFLH